MSIPDSANDEPSDEEIQDELGYCDSSDSECEEELTEGIAKTSSSIRDPDRDRAHQNLRLLTHDLLYVAELVCAISDGDIGRVEDILPTLAKMFRGAGGNNYCTEILHFILNLKHVWTPEFA